METLTVSHTSGKLWQELFKLFCWCHNLWRAYIITSYYKMFRGLCNHQAEVIFTLNEPNDSVLGFMFILIYSKDILILTSCGEEFVIWNIAVIIIISKHWMTDGKFNIEPSQGSKHTCLLFSVFGLWRGIMLTSSLSQRAGVKHKSKRKTWECHVSQAWTLIEQWNLNVVCTLFPLRSLRG